MATGDDAVAAGYPLVQNTDMVRKGAEEINLTRDLVARVNDRIPSVLGIDRGGTGASTKTNARQNIGISSGTASPTGGEDGDIYFKIQV